MTPKEEKREIYSILAKNRYAHKPEHINQRRWSAIKSIMGKRYYREYMRSPEGLYTSEQIWHQTFSSYIN